jgi:zinc transporter 1/2/3
MSLLLTLETLGLNETAAENSGSQHDDDVLFNGKLALILVIGPVTFFASLVPWIIERRFFQKMDQVLAFGSALSAGVILGAAFSHILPEARESFELYFQGTDSDVKNYPFAELFSILTLFALISLDKLVIDKLFHGRALEDEEKLLHQNQNGNEEHQHHESIIENHLALSFSSFKNGENSGYDLKKKIGAAYLFLVAISVHSVFDGLAVGSENSQGGFYGILIAVTSHKLLDGLALGIPIYNAKFSKLQSYTALLFSSLMTPLGILIGWLLSFSKSNLITAILLSLSQGSFVYISLVELLPAALVDRNKIGWKLLTTFLAWALMALIALWV